MKLRLSRYTIQVILGAWIIILNVYIFLYHADTISESLKNITNTKGTSDNEDYDDTNGWSFEFEDSDEYNNMRIYQGLNTSILDSTTITLYQRFAELKDDRNIKPIFSTNYESIFKHHPEPLEIIANLDFQERCDLYFQHLFLNRHNWYVNPDEALPLEGRNEFAYRTWKHNKMNEMKDKFKQQHKLGEDDDIDNEKLEEFIKYRYTLFWNQTLKVEQKSVDMINNLKVFNKCYLTKDKQAKDQFIESQKRFSKIIGRDIPSFQFTSDEKTVKINTKNCNDLEMRIYPWLSMHYPIFEKWNGDIQLHPPKYNNYKSSTPNLDKNNNNGCFLSKFKSDLDGRGIVLTLGDTHLENTLNLIKLLRALDNTLPIQIVYYDNLGANTKKEIVKAAREPFKDLPASFENISHMFRDNYDHGLPKQEIWFVNAFNAVHEKYRDKFSSYGNKLLATVFNSFEEFILVDSDIVIFKNPNWFFDIAKYKESGAYFYKDRSTGDIRPESDTHFFKKMFPSSIDSVMFGIPMVSEKTLDLEGMNGEFHFMEAGVVALDRIRHFNSILLMPQLYFMSPFKHRIYGEKEFFWLAFAVNGDEDYEFDKYFAAAVGEIKPDRVRKNGKPYQAKQICNAHPAHLSDADDSLVWLNSGFHFCGKYHLVDYENDLKKQGNRYLKTFETVEEIRKYYYDPIDIVHAIIPPFIDAHHNDFPNSEEEPPTGWEMTHVLCHDYMWCTYSSIGAGENYHNGTIINFSKEERDYFKYLGDIWVGNE
ncbi:mannosyltransferase putative-domain-containing protein [Scheffersomyces amazonensis]|uniref:mannosyltransferase putative-domain-containing protein n=1 Tax=Scheffersomyces amazonensis TaxID=1078765 RepID=UPI00315D58D9